MSEFFIYINFYHNQQPVMKTFHDFAVDVPFITNIENENKSIVRWYATFIKNRSGLMQVTPSTRETRHNSKNI